MVECSLSQHSMCDDGCHRGGRLCAVQRAETHCKLRALGKTHLSDHQPDELVSKPLFLFFVYVLVSVILKNGLVF